jgi:hypothetical protein
MTVGPACLLSWTSSRRGWLSSGGKRRFLALIDAYHTAGSEYWARRPKTIDAVIEAAD